MIKKKSFRSSFLFSFDLGLLLFHMQYELTGRSYLKDIYLSSVIFISLSFILSIKVFTPDLQFAFSGNKNAFKTTLEVKLAVRVIFVLLELFVIQLNLSHQEIMECSAKK